MSMGSEDTFIFSVLLQKKFYNHFCKAWGFMLQNQGNMPCCISDVCTSVSYFRYFIVSVWVLAALVASPFLFYRKVVISEFRVRVLIL